MISTFSKTLEKFATADLERKIWLAQRAMYVTVSRLLAPFLYAVLHIMSRGRPVRIGTLDARGRISIMILYIEPYLRELKLKGVINPLFIVINPGRCPNEQLSKMYGRKVWLLDDRHSWLRRIFSVVYNCLYAARSPIAPLLRIQLSVYARAYQEGAPALEFTTEEEGMGTRLLANMGIPEEAPYVCFGLRESAYYQKIVMAPEAYTRHRNIGSAEPDTYIRNPPLENYFPMATGLANNGTYVLRMGEVVGEPVPVDLHPKVIDYANKCRSAFGDVYLLANCKFVVAGGAGLHCFATAFNRPVVITDNYSMDFRPPREGNLFIPKKLWFVAERRFLSFKEMLRFHARYTFESNCLRDGIQMVHNTPEEVWAVVREMEQRLDGSWQTTDEDDELQHRFDAIFQPDDLHAYGLPSCIGAEFLREHAHLLD